MFVPEMEEEKETPSSAGQVCNLAKGGIATANSQISFAGACANKVKGRIANKNANVK